MTFEKFNIFTSVLLNEQIRKEIENHNAKHDDAAFSEDPNDIKEWELEMDKYVFQRNIQMGVVKNLMAPYDLQERRAMKKEYQDWKLTLV